MKHKNLLMIKDAFTLGIYCYLYFLKKDKEIDKNELCDHFDVGIGKIRKSFSKLKSLGLIEYVKERDDNGRIYLVRTLIKD